LSHLFEIKKNNCSTFTIRWSSKTTTSNDFKLFDKVY